MSKKYKEAMDKIVISDELKTKIIENTTKNQLPVKANPKHTKAFYFRYGVGYAASLLLCFLAVSLSRNFIETDNMPSETNVPGYVSPVPEPTNAISPEKPANDVLPENNSIEYQKPAVNVEQNNTNHHVAAETQRMRGEKPNIAIPPETQTPENNEPVFSENNPANEENSLQSSLGNEDNQVVSPTNPSNDAENFSDIREQLGYDFKVPQYLPEGYKLDTVSLMFGSLVQISYLSENDEIVYRTEKTDADISGDYNVYDTVETETINGVDTTLRGSDGVFYGAAWNDGEMSYSIGSTNGFEKDILVQIAENVDFPVEQEQTASTAQSENIDEKTEENSANAEALTEQNDMNMVEPQLKVNENDKEDNIPKKRSETMDNMD